MKNEFEIRGDVTAIIINSPKNGRYESLISTSKLEKVNEFTGTWRVLHEKRGDIFYVHGRMPQANEKYKSVFLHRLVMDAPDGMIVDHRNHDGLNNTDENLRICTHAENHQNRNGANSLSKSGIRGVCWHKHSGKWIVQAGVNGKTIYLGLFTDILEAEKVAKEARSNLMPYAN